MTVNRNITFPVLVGIERTRVNVYIRVKLLDCDVVTSGLKKFSY